ncbi:YdcF family protein [Pseudonocardiaceae bacterium YIM PH 21723]|nr:YdcF family protein [Pseudonocardiaceae bacterium YIM PH 21723]
MPVGVRTGALVVRWMGRLLVGAVLMGLLILGGTVFRVWQVARSEDHSRADIAVVLGAAQYNGTPTDVLKWRLQHALNLYREQATPVLVTVGGKQPGDKFTEAEASKNWLVEHGVPASAVVTVAEGRDTLGSIRAVATEAERRGWRSAIMVSDPWHSLRTRTMARDAGLDAWASPVRSGPIVQTRSTQIRYIVRETGALLYYRLTHVAADETSENSGVGVG